MTGPPTEDRPNGLRPLIGLLILGVCLTVPLQTPAQIPPVVSAPSSADLLKSARQREKIEALAKRRLGVRIVGDRLEDLAILQRMLDERVVSPDDVPTLQAMGVVLGDVMAARLPLAWIVIDDDAGRSRALRYKETRQLFFPITMISKRAQFREPVDVQALYESVADQVATFQSREIPRRTRPSLPPRPERVVPGDS